MFRTRITWNIYIYSLIHDCENLKIDHRGNKKESAFKSARNRFSKPYHTRWTSQLALMVKNTPASVGDSDSIPGSGRSPGEENGNTPVFLPGKSQGQRSLVSYSPGLRKSCK